MSAIACELRTVRLYGPLGTAFGRVHRLAVSSAAEAVRALCVLFPGFERHMVESKDKGIGYAVFYGKRNLEKEALRDDTNEDIRIAPMLIGSKNGGIFNIILGAALVVVGVIGNAYGGWGTPFINAGIAMIAGGAVQLLSPTTKPRSSDNGSGQGSYIFSGAVNTTAQGNPVPVLYGEMIVGSAVISAGLVASDGTVIAGTVPEGGYSVTNTGRDKNATAED